MREEYCLGKLSQAYTYITFALIIEAVALSACDTTIRQRDVHESPVMNICEVDTIDVKTDSVSQDTFEIFPCKDTLDTSLLDLKR